MSITLSLLYHLRYTFLYEADVTLDGMTGIYEIFFKAVWKLRENSTLGRRLSNKWLPAEPWVKALKMSHLIDPIFEINAQKFNKAMSTASCDWSQASNVEI